MATNNTVRRRRRSKAYYRRKRIRQIKVYGGAIIILLIALNLFWWLSSRGMLEEGKIANQVYVDGVDVSGMTKGEASESLETHLKDVGRARVNIESSQGDYTSKLSEFGIKPLDTDVEQMVEEAYNLGRKGLPITRYFRLRKAKKKGYNFQVAYSIDANKADGVFSAMEESLGNAPVNASLMVVNGEVKIHPGKEGYAVKRDESVEALNELIGADWDKEDLTLSVETETSEPEITEKLLGECTDVLGSYKTYCGVDNSGRVQNVKNGAALMDGTILMPGEEFSGDAAMRPYTEENGFTNAGSYESGEIVETMGGGICQVSSTLYNAVLYAELEVTERCNHSMLVDYVEPSRDAAIADDIKDFKFRNSTAYPIIISAGVENGYCYFTIYGKETRDKNREIDFESEVLGEEDYGVTYKASEDYSVGTMTTVSGGKEGASARLWKVVKVNGKETERVQVNESDYLPRNSVVIVGVKMSDGAIASGLISAVQTQDEDKIRQAIETVLE